MAHINAVVENGKHEGWVIIITARVLGISVTHVIKHPNYFSYKEWTDFLDGKKQVLGHGSEVLRARGNNMVLVGRKLDTENYPFLVENENFVEIPFKSGSSVLRRLIDIELGISHVLPRSPSPSQLYPHDIGVRARNIDVSAVDEAGEYEGWVIIITTPTSRGIVVRHIIKHPNYFSYKEWTDFLDGKKQELGGILRAKNHKLVMVGRKMEDENYPTIEETTDLDFVSASKALKKVIEEANDYGWFG
jgi:hypothetical protein